MTACFSTTLAKTTLPWLLNALLLAIMVALLSMPGEHAAMHTEWLPGVCGTTSEGEGATCQRSDTQGAAAGVRNLSACLAFCAACPRCRFISFSEHGADCSWYAVCDTSRLKQSWLRHWTAQVRHAQRPRRCQAAQLDSRGAWREEPLFAGWRCPLWETSHARFNCSGDLPQGAHSVPGCGRPNAAASLLGDGGGGGGGGHRTLFFVGDPLSAQHARAVACRVLYDATHATHAAPRSRHAAPRRSASVRTHLPRWAAAVKPGSFLVPACTPECHEVSAAALSGARDDDTGRAAPPTSSSSSSASSSSSLTVCYVPAGTRDRGCAEGVLPVVERLLASRVVRWEDAIIMNEGLHHSQQVRSRFPGGRPALEGRPGCLLVVAPTDYPTHPQPTTPGWTDSVHVTSGQGRARG